MVIIVLFAGVGPGHLVGGKSREVSARAMEIVAIVRVVPVGVVVVRRGGQCLALNLVSGLCQHRNVAAAGMQTGLGKSKGRVRVRRRDVGRSQCRSRGRADGLGSWGRSHHTLVGEVRLLLVWLLVKLSLVAPPGVGVVVDAGVPGQLIRAREFLGAARELAGVRLLSSVGANVPGLVLQPVESLVTERALVRARQLIAVVGGLGARNWAVGLQNGDCASHFAFSLVRPFAVLVRRCCWIE